MNQAAPSILNQLKLSFLGFGLSMGLVFPFYANFFVNWREGMLIWFCFGCLVAGITIGIINHKLLQVLLVRKLRQIAVASERMRKGDLREGCGVRSHDTVGEITEGFDAMASGLRETIRDMANSASLVDTTAKEIGTAMASMDNDMVEHRTNAGEILKVVNGLSDAADSILSLSGEAGKSASSAEDLVRSGFTHVVATEQASRWRTPSRGQRRSARWSREST